MKIPISQITILPRQRLDLGDISAQADSMKRLGQLQDILVEKVAKDSYTLIAGMRRLTAAKTLGWTDIGAKVLDEKVAKKLMESSGYARDLFIQELELEEDTKRKDRTWQELCIVYLKLNRLKKLSDPMWSRAKLADLFNKSVGHVSECLAIAEALERTKEQKTDWEKGLWMCESIYTACQYLALRNEEAAYQEIVRRKAIVDINMGRSTEPMPPAQGEVHVVNPTPVMPLFEARKVEVFNRQSKEEECQVALLFGRQANFEEGGACSLQKKGNLLWWLDSIDDWMELRNRYRDQDQRPLPWPIVWNRITGPSWKDSPFKASVAFGLFVRLPEYWNPHPEAPVGSVLIAPQLSQLVQASLDAMCKEGDKVWLPFGGPVLEVAQAGRIPVWQEKDPTKNVEKLKELQDFYTSQYGKVEFI